MRKHEKLLGYSIDISGFEGCLEYALSECENRSRRVGNCPPQSLSECENKGIQVVTINPEMIAFAKKNSEFAQVLHSAELVIPDGVGIKLGMKLKGIDIEQVPGIEFSKKIIERCAQEGKKIGLLGAKEEVIQAAAANLKKEFPSLEITFQRNGYFQESEELEIIEKIKASGVKVLFVALGAPKQELFIAKYKENLQNMLLVGVGGSFDVWAGKVKRAPLIFRKCGCEWLYRVVTQPSRFKRIFPTLPLFLFEVIMEVRNKTNAQV